MKVGVVVVVVVVVLDDWVAGTGFSSSPVNLTCSNFESCAPAVDS